MNSSKKSGHQKRKSSRMSSNMAALYNQVLDCEGMRDYPLDYGTIEQLYMSFEKKSPFGLKKNGSTFKSKPNLNVSGVNGDSYLEGSFFELV